MVNAGTNSYHTTDGIKGARERKHAVNTSLMAVSMNVHKLPVVGINSSGSGQPPTQALVSVFMQVPN